MKNNRNNQMIEIMRFLSCLVILFIHCGLPNPYGRFLNYYGRFAVPFFLLVSGYFAYGGDLSAKSAKKASQTLCLIFTHGTICILWNCVNAFLSSGSFTNWIQPYLTAKHFQNFVFYNRAIFINSVFYYLFMILYVYIFCLIVCKIKLISSRHVYGLALCLFLIAYYKLQFTSVDWYEIGNFLFTGIPLFFLGHFYHAKPQIFRTVKGKEVFIVLIGVLITYLECTMLRSTYLSFGQIAIASSLLCFCINNSNANGGILASFGSRCSLYVMLYHCQIRDTTRIFIGTHPRRIAFATMILSISIAVILDSLSSVTKVMKNSWYR